MSDLFQLGAGGWPGGMMMKVMRAYANESAMLCAGAFVLLLATAISNFIRLDVDTGTAPFGEYLSQFMIPAIPLALVLVLLVLRVRAAVTIVATLGTLLCLFDWATLGL